jgi:hypothetical protein
MSMCRIQVAVGSQKNNNAVDPAETRCSITDIKCSVNSPKADTIQDLTCSAPLGTQEEQ